MTYKIIAELANTSSSLAKEAILLREANARNTELFTAFRMAYSQLITYGIQKVPKKRSAQKVAPFPFQEFCALAGRLERRELTGNAAHEAVELAMWCSDRDVWNGLYRLILLKDLRCGVTATTINKVTKKFPQYSIPKFSCQLAFDGAKHEAKLVGKKLIEVKLDGARVLTIVHPDGHVAQFSRNGKSIVNFPVIRAQFEDIAENLTEAMVFDGEIMTANFQDLMTQLYRKANVATDTAMLYSFDCISLADFQRGISNVPQFARTSALSTFLRTHAAKTPNIDTLGYTILDLSAPTDIARFTALNKRALREGYEGLVLKDPLAPYVCKRTTAWLKRKPFLELDAIIVDLQEGTGKYAGMLGALVCTGVDEGRIIEVNVGSGFTDELRATIWDEPAAAIGHTVEIRADAITQNQHGGYSLRFPRFLRFKDNSG